VCGSPERGDEMILCDACDMGWHLACVTPPLPGVSAYYYYCYAICRHTTTTAVSVCSYYYMG
jgi:hypothetical protein